jgi:hypothetical protein
MGGHCDFSWNFIHPRSWGGGGEGPEKNYLVKMKGKGKEKVEKRKDASVQT